MLELSLKALQIALGIGAVALAAVAGTTLASFSGPPDPGAPTTSIDAGQLRPSDASLPRYRVIADRNLFNLKGKAVAAPVEAPIVESKLQIQLLGTVARTVAVSGDVAQPDADQPPQAPQGLGSLAIVRDTNGDVVTLAVGDMFAENRAKLVRVEPRRIVLEQNGRLEAVLLDEESEAPPRRPVAGGPNRTFPGGVGGAGGLPGLVRDATNAMAQSGGSDAAMTAMLRQLGSQMVASIEKDPSGTGNLLRVQRINEGSPLQGIGLQAGDGIKAVNGQGIGGSAAMMQIFAAFSGGSDARLTVQDASGRVRELVLPGSVAQRLMVPR